jgi:DTW domain-containing protein
MAAAPAADRCPACFLRGRCLCPDVRPVANRTEILIVRHAAELGKTSNSGRLAALALERARLLEHGVPGAPRVGEALAGPDTWLLFPEPGAPLPDRPPARLVVLDATWSQARKMRRRLGELRGMPVLTLPGVGERLRTLRTPPRPGQLPTLLAIAEALAILEGDAIAAPLRALWDLAVERMTADRRRPDRFLAP